MLLELTHSVRIGCGSWIHSRVLCLTTHTRPKIPAPTNAVKWPTRAISRRINPARGIAPITAEDTPAPPGGSCPTPQQCMVLFHQCKAPVKYRRTVSDVRRRDGAAVIAQHPHRVIALRFGPLVKANCSATRELVFGAPARFRVALRSWLPRFGFVDHLARIL